MTFPEREKTFQYGKMNFFFTSSHPEPVIIYRRGGGESKDFYLDTIKLT